MLKETDHTSQRDPVIAAIHERRLASRIAREIGLTGAAVRLWKKVPPEHAAAVEKILAEPPRERTNRHQGIGQRLLMARKARGYAQEDVAEACGVTRAAVANWERGKTGLTEENLRVAAAFLQVPYEWLRYGTGVVDLPERLPGTRRALRDIAPRAEATRVAPPYANHKQRRAAGSHEAQRDAIVTLLLDQGLINAVAEKTGLTRQAVYLWHKVPWEYVRAVEEVTGIPRVRIRPDIAWWLEQPAAFQWENLPPR